MAWADPLGDLRRFIADSPNDNLVKDKKVLGDYNTGGNRTFYTFDDRLLASGNQSVCGKPLRVFYGGAELQASGILITDQIRGEFQLLYVQPSGSQKKLTATYYYQQSLDDELNMDLQQGANQMSAATAAQVDPGLQLSAMDVAASMAYTRLANRWQQRKSEQFLLEDEPARNEAEARITFYQKESDRLMKAGTDGRTAFYNLRLGRGLQPSFGVLSRTPRPYTPRE